MVATCICPSGAFSEIFTFLDAFVQTVTLKVKVMISIESAYISFYPSVTLIMCLSCTISTILALFNCKKRNMTGHMSRNVLDKPKKFKMFCT